MVRLKNHLGTISISQNFFVNLVASAASSCFGVAAMAGVHPAADLFSRLKGRHEDTRGVRIRTRGSGLIIDLHIIVTYGVNIAAIVKSIMHKVSYTVEDVTGIPVEHVNVFVDGMRTN
ncbi:MAG TPA: Asp23/Gls24 family envelope stress response protein [Candidatus Merdivicinus intestinigallinarum]|nr:Asp23/Gls24 family envelope stress response protein [Candidatus Merdivicinus intestinigallinarum]